LRKRLGEGLQCPQDVEIRLAASLAMPPRRSPGIPAHWGSPGGRSRSSVGKNGYVEKVAVSAPLQSAHVVADQPSAAAHASFRSGGEGVVASASVSRTRSSLPPGAAARERPRSKNVKFTVCPTPSAELPAESQAQISQHVPAELPPAEESLEAASNMRQKVPTGDSDSQPAARQSPRARGTRASVSRAAKALEERRRMNRNTDRTNGVPASSQHQPGNVLARHRLTSSDPFSSATPRGDASTSSLPCPTMLPDDALIQVTVPTLLPQPSLGQAQDCCQAAAPKDQQEPRAPRCSSLLSQRGSCTLAAVATATAVLEASLAKDDNAHASLKTGSSQPLVMQVADVYPAPSATATPVLSERSDQTLRRPSVVTFQEAYSRSETADTRTDKTAASDGSGIGAVRSRGGHEAKRWKGPPQSGVSPYLLDAAGVDHWTPFAVARWAVGALGLPSEVGELLANEEVSGPVLLSLVEDDLRHLLGAATPFGQRRILYLGIQELSAHRSDKDTEVLEEPGNMLDASKATYNLEEVAPRPCLEVPRVHASARGRTDGGPGNDLCIETGASGCVGSFMGAPPMNDAVRQVFDWQSSPPPPPVLHHCGSSSSSSSCAAPVSSSMTSLVLSTVPAPTHSGGAPLRVPIASALLPVTAAPAWPSMVSRSGGLKSPPRQRSPPALVSRGRASPQQASPQMARQPSPFEARWSSQRQTSPCHSSTSGAASNTCMHSEAVSPQWPTPLPSTTNAVAPVFCIPSVDHLVCNPDACLQQPPPCTSIAASASPSTCGSSAIASSRRLSPSSSTVAVAPISCVPTADRPTCAFSVCARHPSPPSSATSGAASSSSTWSVDRPACVSSVSTSSTATTPRFAFLHNLEGVPITMPQKSQVLSAQSLAPLMQVTMSAMN